MVDSVYESVVVEGPPIDGGEPDSNEVEGGDTATPETEVGVLGIPTVLGGSEPTELEITLIEVRTECPEKCDINGITRLGDKVNDPDIRIDMDRKVAIIYDWKLPKGHSYTNGSTYTFQMPDKFKLGAGLSGDLDGEVGTYIVTPAGEVTFTFNENVVTVQEETGYFYVFLEFDQNKIKDGELEQTIVFAPLDTEITVHFNNPKAKDNQMNKTGEASSTMNPSHIDWEVDFNLNEETITGAKFQDTFQDGLTFEFPLEVIPLTIKLNGNKEEGTPIKFDSAETIDGKTLSMITGGFQIELGDINKTYRVKYKTKVAPIVDSPYQASLKNNAALYGNSNSDPLFTTEKNVTVNFSKPLSKFFETYDSAKQEITWRIEYNFNEQTIAKVDAFITDTFDKAQELVEDSIKVVKKAIGEGGSATDDGIVDSGAYTVTDISDGDKSGFRLQFNDAIQNAYEIVYKTVSKARVFEDSKNIANTVEMRDGTKASDSTNIGQVIFRKSTTAINYADKTITWKIQLNYDLQEMKDVVITDTFGGQNLTFLENTLSISGLTKDTDYNITTDDNYNTSFKITFIKNPITSSHDITFKTKYDSTQIPASKNYTNNGTVDWTDAQNNSQTKSSSATRKLDEYSGDNGNKTGVYNAQTKEITWTIDVNYNLHNIGKAIIKDKYTGEQSFVIDEDSLKVNKLDLEGSANTVVVKDLVPVTKVDTDPQVDEYKLDENGFTLNLGQINSAYRITYKTSLANTYINGSYTNNAILTDAEDSNKELFKKGTTVTPKHGSEVITKSGAQGKNADEDIATWTVTLNRSQSHIAAGSKLTDELQGDQVLIPSSIKVYKPTVATNGNVNTPWAEVTNGFTLEVVNDKSFTLTFNNVVDTAYIVQYQSFINANDGETIKNNAQYETKLGKGQTENNDKPINVSFAQAGGGTVPQKGYLKLRKADDQGNPLAGVEFKLYSTTGTFLETLTTDANGEATTTNKYRYHNSGIKYKLEEVAIPAGYLGSEYAVAGGKEISFKDASSTFVIINPKIRQSIELTKTDAGSNPLEGVEFALYLKGEDGNYKKVQENLKTDSNGKILVENLEPGDYQLIETKALEGYWLDTTPVDFVVEKNQTKVTTKTMKNYLQGNLKIKKVEEDTSTPLAGAVFKLYLGSEEIAEVTTDSSGIAEFKNIKYGTYTLKETIAPDGYLLDAISAIVIGKNVTVNEPSMDLGTFTNKKILNALKLVKKDATDVGKLLAGAEFTLQSVSGGVYEDIHIGLTTNNDGEIQIGDLPAGDYRLTETKAPQYYVLGNQSYDFTIQENQTWFSEILAENTRGEGSIIITKVDAANKDILLDGVEFTLTDGNGYVRTATTDDNGKIEFTNLPYDTYTLKETKAHTDYVPNSDEITIVLDSESSITGETKEVTIENTKKDYSVRLTKYNADKSLKLQGAVFELRQKVDGEYIVLDEITAEQLTTDENGGIYLELAVGNYQLIEVTAPNGYRLDSEPVAFEIVENQTATTEVEKTNIRKSSGGGGGGGGGSNPPEPPEEEPKDEDKDDPKKDEEKPVKPEEPKKEDPKEDEKEVEIPEVPKDPGTGKPDDPFKEETPKDTPKEGEVEVPEDSTTKVGEEPKNGEVTVDDNGKWTYTPKPGFVGKDKFTIITIDKDGNETETFFEMEVGEVPLGSTSVPDKLPKTGADSYLIYYLIGLSFVVLGLRMRRKPN